MGSERRAGILSRSRSRSHMPMGRRNLLMRWKMWVKGRNRTRLLASMTERKVVVVVNKVLAMVSGLRRSLEILALLLLLLLNPLLLLLLVMVECGDVLEILVLLVRPHAHIQPHLWQGIPAVRLFHCSHLLQLHKRVSLLFPLLRRWRWGRMLRMPAIVPDQ